MPNIDALFGGGGTGGHVIPGLAVAEELVSRGTSRGSIQFVGSTRGIDENLVALHNFGFVGLPGRGIQRSLKPRAMIANCGALAGLVVGVVRGVWIVRRSRPRVVVSVGGYSSFATSVGAIVWRVPLILMEQNAKAGAANRAVRWFSTAAATSFPDTDLPRQIVTGNPVRSEILAVDRQRDRLGARHILGLQSDTFVVAIACGSLGARRINTAVFGLAKLWRERANVELYHVIGKRDFAATADQQSQSARGALAYHAVEFEDRMAQVYAAADVIIGRAGGTTMAELSIVGVPAISVPLPIAPRDHQRANAMAMGEAVVILADQECTAERLAAVLQELSDAPGRLDRMAAAARARGHRDAAARVADVVSLHMKPTPS